jgi:hypothetical protein
MKKIGMVAALAVALGILTGCSSNFGAIPEQLGKAPSVGMNNLAAQGSTTAQGDGTTSACADSIMSSTADLMDSIDVSMTAALKVSDALAYGILPDEAAIQEANATSQRTDSQMTVMSSTLKEDLAQCPEVQDAPGYDRIVPTLTTAVTEMGAYQDMQTAIQADSAGWLTDPAVQAAAQTVSARVGDWQVGYLGWKKDSGR